MTREILFSVTAADCIWSYTKGTGKGGQKKNVTSSAVHCAHKPSKAHGYSEASRSQRKNKEEAFGKMANSKEFKQWHKIESARRSGKLADVDLRVQCEMKKIRVEVKDINDKWVEVNKKEFVPCSDFYLEGIFRNEVYMREVQQSDEFFSPNTYGLFIKEDDKMLRRYFDKNCIEIIYSKLEVL